MIIFSRTRINALCVSALSLLLLSCMTNNLNIVRNVQTFQGSAKKVYLTERFSYGGDTTPERFKNEYEGKPWQNPLSGNYIDPKVDPVGRAILQKFKGSAAGEFPKAPESEEEVSLLLKRSVLSEEGSGSKACLNMVTLGLFPVTTNFFYEDQLYKFNIITRKYELLSSTGYTVERNMFLFNIFRGNDELYNNEDKRSEIIANKLLNDAGDKL